MSLQSQIELYYTHHAETYGEEYLRVFDEFKAALNEGRVRAAEPDKNSPSGWKANAWVKKGILLGFRIGRNVDMRVGQSEAVATQAMFQFRDKHTYPLKRIPATQSCAPPRRLAWASPPGSAWGMRSRVTFPTRNPGGAGNLGGPPATP